MSRSGLFPSRAGVVSLAASPLGTIAASSSLDCFVRVFDVDSNATVANLDGGPAEAWGLSFMPESVSPAW